MPADDDKTRRIRALNDRLRRTRQGGTVLLTTGVRALGAAAAANIVAQVARFEAFTEDNDPYGEHDCATMTVAGVTVIWKIDYHDRALQFGSPDPSDPDVTARVLTIMLAEEY